MAHNKVEKLKLITESLRKGVLLTQAISDAGIRSHQTLTQWWTRDPRIKKLIRVAQDLCDQKRVQVIEDALYNNAKGGNVTAQIFFLKNQAPDRWKDRTESVNRYEGNITHNHEINYESYGTTKDEVAKHAERLLAQRQGVPQPN